MIHERLRRDSILFGMVLTILWVTSFSLAVTWHYFHGPELIFGVVATSAAAVYLFHLRQTNALERPHRK